MKYRYPTDAIIFFLTSTFQENFWISVSMQKACSSASTSWLAGSASASQLWRLISILSEQQCKNLHPYSVPLAFKEAVHTNPWAARVTDKRIWVFLIAVATFGKMESTWVTRVGIWVPRQSNSGAQHAGSVLAGQAQPLPTARAHGTSEGAGEGRNAKSLVLYIIFPAT